MIAQVTPVLCGSATTPFAATVRRRLQAACPGAIIHSQFLGPRELAALYSATRLNFHPCRYDAYGMTIVEAASQGGACVSPILHIHVPCWPTIVSLPEFS